MTAYRTNWTRNRRESDSLYRLIGNYRTRTLKAFKLIGQKKNDKSLKLLGLKNSEEFAELLSKQFYDHPETGEEMTLDNHGLYGWQLDHIVPLFTAKTEEDVIKLSHYTNLQPLWVEDHIAKTTSDLKKYKILDRE